MIIHLNIYNDILAFLKIVKASEEQNFVVQSFEGVKGSPIVLSAHLPPIPCKKALFSPPKSGICIDNLVFSSILAYHLTRLI